MIDNTKPSSISSKQKITSVTSNYYEYKFKDFLNINDSKDKKAYDLLKYSDYGYWLATNFTNITLNNVKWGICRVEEDYITGGNDGIVKSNDVSGFGIIDIYTGYLRVVVVLNSNVTLTGSSSAGWNIS